MKKKIYTIMSILLLTGICHAAPVILDDKEEKENDKKHEKHGNQEEPCYDITSTYLESTGQLSIRFVSSIAHVNIEVCRDGETVMSLSDLNKAKGSYEWINLSCFGSGDYDVYVTVDDCIIHYVSITI